MGADDFRVTKEITVFADVAAKPERPDRWDRLAIRVALARSDCLDGRYVQSGNYIIPLYN